jgi:hypothetical protein
MSDAPYSSAIEETAKTTGKALDLVKDGALPIADIYGLIIGDQVHAARHRRLDAITRKTKQILRDRDLSETAEVAEQIAIPFLEAAQGEPREDMQNLWARLLANAMDPSRRDDVRPEFINALRKFHPIDAVVLEWMGKDDHKKRWHTPNNVSSEVKVRLSSIVVTIQNLVESGCVKRNPSTGQFVISDFGIELLLACRT